MNTNRFQSQKKNEKNKREVQPLQGIRVVDLTWVWTGPIATRYLADFGADVIKVECPLKMDLNRGPFTDPATYNYVNNFHAINRNKRSITLDLRNETCRSIFYDLVRISDILINNFRYDFLKGIGLDYDSLKNVKPDLVYVSMPAFGCSGPYASVPGYGASIEAISGIQGLTAYDKESMPFRIKEMDSFNALNGASAMMTALIYRQQTGIGQFIDLSQIEATTFGLLGESLLEYELNKEVRQPVGNRHRYYAPHGCYRCAGDDAWVTLSIRTQDEWQQFCDRVGHPEWLEDHRFTGSKSRIENSLELDELIESWTLHHTHYEVMNVLQEAGIPSGAVLNMKEFCSDVHIKERGFIGRLTDRTGDDLKPMPTFPYKFNSIKNHRLIRAPSLGEDNEYVLCELLGRDKEDLVHMEFDEVIPSLRP